MILKVTEASKYIGVSINTLRRKKVKESRLAWAINTNYTDIDNKIYNGFIGRGWIGSQWNDKDDFRQAIFRTRISARKELFRIQQSFPNAKIVRVRITIEELT